MANTPLQFFKSVPFSPLPVLIVGGDFPAPYTLGTPIALNTVEIDTYNAYSTITGGFTVPVRGIYRCSATAGGSFSNNSLMVFTKNGVTVSGGWGSTFGGGQPIASIRLISAEVGDVLDFRNSSNSSISTSVYNNLSIELVSPLE